MKEWTFRELRDGVNEDLKEYETDEELNYTSGQVAGRCLVELTTVMNQGYTEKIISYVTVGRYIVEKCSEDSKKYYKKELIEILRNYDRSKLDKDITEDEKRELEQDIRFVMDELKKI